jgi:thiol-disulfide isomerase/thioredoxin
MKYQKIMSIFLFLSLFQLALYAETTPKILEETTMQTVDGETIQVQRMKNGLIFKDYEDKIVLLEAFGHSCPPCKASIPGYNRLQKKYAKDVVIIAIEAWGSDNSGLKLYAKQHGIEYKAVSKASSGKIIRFMQNLTGWVPGLGVPYLMLFNKGGVLAKDVPPQALHEAYVEGLIQKLL